MMQQQEYLLDTPIQEENNVPIFSSIAVGIFTFFFSAIFGGIMTYQNLRRVGKPDIANKVLLGCIVYFAALIVFEVAIGIPTILTLPLNIGAAWVLGNYVHTTYIPNHKDMPKRKIWIPLAIGLVLFALIIAGVVFGGDIA